ncbi:MAG: HAD family hydrolase [Deltaproteobacteria bacterium]|nr:HAD family hydrolase [Deltaproteobacteria bacterium]
MTNQTKLQAAVFLDRDGVLIHDVDYLSDLKDIHIYEDVPEALSKLKKAGFLLIMVTNQSGVARGYFDEKFVEASYGNIQASLQNQSATLDGMYFCPHHIIGRPPYNIKCNCRKPLPGMILEAEKQFNIDLSRSYMLGDKLCDVELAKNSRTVGLLLKTG